MQSSEVPTQLEKISGGCANDLWKVEMPFGVIHILRTPKVKVSEVLFSRISEISKRAFEAGVGVKVLEIHYDEQKLLLEYIKEERWPTYDVDREPYHATMKALKCFHEKVSLSIHPEAYFAPFSFIFNASTSLQTHPDMPVHYTTAIKRTNQIYAQLQPLLKNNAVLCHGDFHKGNVLLSKNCPPKLIDFDSAAFGDPLFDVVKFSVALPKPARQSLFAEYLERVPTPQDQSHYELADLALLMVITTVRFKSVPPDTQPRLTKSEMETLLDSPTPLPSFLNVPFGDTSPKARQLGALYALSEFLSRSTSL